MPGVKQWFQTVVRLYGEPDGRRRVRLSAEFDTILSGPFGTLYATAFDVNRDGIGIRSPSPLEIGELLFVKIPALGLMGFAHVRHCARRADRYQVGLKFREALAHDRETDGFECRRLRREAFRDWNEMDLS